MHSKRKAKSFDLDLVKNKGRPRYLAEGSIFLRPKMLRSWIHWAPLKLALKWTWDLERLTFCLSNSKTFLSCLASNELLLMRLFPSKSNHLWIGYVTKHVRILESWWKDTGITVCTELPLSNKDMEVVVTYSWWARSQKIARHFSKRPNSYGCSR